MQSQLSGQPLTTFIRTRIEENGPVTVAQFMEWALYHPEHGYYMTGPNIGPRGDFTTSPEASPAFGKLLARHVTEVDALLDHPSTLYVVEFGPGRGTLAKSLLDTLKSQYAPVYKRTKYILVEISPALKAEQVEIVSQAHGDKCLWVDGVFDLPEAIEGAVIANELVDAFPVHVVENHDGAIHEQYVAIDGTRFKLIPGPLSSPLLEEFARTADISLLEGEQIEVNLEMVNWVQALAEKLRRGVAVVIDYGDTQPGRYSEGRKQGTLLGYFGGSVTHEITANPGQQDLTALVDFTALKVAAEQAGLVEIGLTRQAHFLLGLGLGTTETAESFAGDSRDIPAVLEYRRGLQALISMEGLGKFHVSILARGLDAAAVRSQLSGLKYADFI